jgi:NADH-quinone oxidoreductase subunit A
VQFDSRFYVVALLFIVFEVEAAFFFPWASVYGRAVQLMRPAETIAVSGELSGGNDKPEKGAPAGDLALNGATTARLRDLGVRHPQLPVPAGGIQANEDKLRQSGRLLAKTAIVDIGVFFGILLVGFAYVWKRGDLDWVRALGDHAPVSGPPKDPGIEAR